MKKTLTLAFILTSLTVFSQEKNFDVQLHALTQQIDSIVMSKNRALQKTIDSINQQVANHKYTKEEGMLIKKEVARKYAEEVDFIIFKRTHELKKWLNGQKIVRKVTIDDKEKTIQYTIRVLSQKNQQKKQKRIQKRNYNRWFLAAGFNNVVKDKQVSEINESPYGLWQSRFLEFGFDRKTAFAKGQRFAYFTYGASISWNTLKPSDNKYHMLVHDTVRLVRHSSELSTDKLRNVWLNVPVGIEFHIPTTKYNYIKFAVGAYAKLRIKTKQKLEFEQQNISHTVIQKGQFNVNSLNYGLTAEIGENDWSIYFNYDLNNLFKHRDWHQVSLGLKWEIN